MRGDFLKAVRFRANIGRGGQEIWAAVCAACGHTFPQGKLQVDHIIPVGPAPGSKNAPPDLTWDSFIDRMFKPASPEFYQLLCKSCHTTKSSEEKSKLAATVRERKGNKDVPAVPRKRARRKPPAPSRVRRTKRSRR